VITWQDVGKILTGAAVLAGMSVIFGWWGGDEQTPSGTKSEDLRFLRSGERAPREFLYLDSARAQAYLSQLDGGNETLRTISETVTRKLGGELTLGPAKVSGEAGSENAIERSVSPTAASTFYGLTDRLGALKMLTEMPSTSLSAADDTIAPAQTATPSDKQAPAAPLIAPSGGSAEANVGFIDAWKGVKEGDVVSFIATIRRPTFVRVYQTIHDAPAKSRLGRQGAALLKAIGTQPRLPFAVEVPSPRRAAPSLRLVMPIQAANLTSEPSMLAPRVRVVAKVVRRLDAEKDRYRDLAFYSRFQPVLTLTPAAVLKRLHAPPRLLRGELLSYRTLRAPGAVILPIAIYK
jgi:hypothetical protein